MTIQDADDSNFEEARWCGIGARDGLDRWMTAVSDPEFGPGLFCSTASLHHLPKPPFDETKPFILMHILKDGIGHGTAFISDMVFETRTRRKIEATGFGVYTANARTPMKMLQESALIFTHILDADITLKSGEVLDILEWDLRFPRTLRTGDIVDLTQWFGTCKRIGVRYPALAPDEVIPPRIRRSDAPRQIIADEEEPRDPTLPPRST